MWKETLIILRNIKLLSSNQSNNQRIVLYLAINQPQGGGEPPHDVYFTKIIQGIQKKDPEIPGPFAIDLLFKEL